MVDLLKLQKYLLTVVLAVLGCTSAHGQTCAAPGKDAPGTPSGIVNTYYQGNGNLAAAATTLTLGPSSGAVGTVTVGDMLLVMQMQGASIDTSDDERYGDGTGTAANRPLTTVSQANGYTALGQAGLYEFVRVTVAAGNAITFTPALANAYNQVPGTAPRRTYQVIRVPQYPSATFNGATPILAAAWTGLVGGVVAVDVAGVVTASGAAPHVNASNRGFRGGVHQAAPNSKLPGDFNYRSANYLDGGSKGEGIAGTPQFVQTSLAGFFNSGTAFTDPVATFVDNGTLTGYTGGDTMRGAPANAGGGANSHNAAGGGGGNGGEGGSGGQTYNGDTPSLADRGGYGGSRTPQDGVLLATRIFMGGGGGSGSMNNSTPPRSSGGNGGGIIILRAGSISGSLTLRADGQRGWEDDNGNDAGGGGGAGGSVVVIAGSGHGNVTVQARGGNGANSNKTPRTGAPNQPCCDGEREGPGGGAGGGVVLSNSPLGSTVLTGGANGNSFEDLFQGFSGNMLAQPGSPGASLSTVASSAIAGARAGYECAPVLTASKSTSTPALSVPPDTSGTYIINVSNAAGLSGTAYGIALTDLLSSPFQLTGTTAIVAYSSAAATGPASPMTITGTGTVAIGTAGSPTNAFTLAPGTNVTVTFKVGLNGATSGTYQNPANINYTDPTRTSGGAATAATNPAVTPGGTNAAGGTVPGSNYASGSSTQEDIVITGAAGTSADLSLVKSGPATAEVGGAVQYILTVGNAGPTNISSSVSVSDTVPANIGTVTWSCALLAGTADCDTLAGGTGASGTGTVALSRIQINSGGQLQITINGTASASGSITNTATVSLPVGFTDPTPGNNTGTAGTVISTPTADLSASKTDGATSVATGGVTVYTIVAANAGPSSANNAVIADPAGTGLVKLSVTCSAQGGASCPSGLSTTTFQAGAQVPLFPAGSTVTFLLTSQITAASGTVTNTVSITAPAGVTEINTTNNTATDTNAVTAATAAVASSANICPANSTESTVNLLTNSDFVNTSSSVGSNITQYPVNNNLPNDGVGPQTGAQTYGTVTQRPFPGDAPRSIGNANNWLYNNGNAGAVAYRFWSQPVSGLVAGRTYEWLYYGSNAQNPGSAVANPPQIQFRIVSGTTTFTLGGTDGYPNEGAAVSDTWTLRQRTFGATTTGVTLQLWDTQTAGAGTGDTFASTQIILRECVPNTDPFVSKTNGTNSVATFGTTSYVVTVGNNGPGAADLIVVKDPAVTGLNKSAITCAAVGIGAACPSSSTVAGIEGAGLTIPTLPVNTTVVFTITASVTALNGSVTNTVSLQLPSGMTDNSLANNTAQDADAVKGLANISVAKTNGVNTLLAGATTAYTVTVANSGPSDATGAVISDPPAQGLSCITAASCTASGGASCAASIPIGTLQSGYTIPGLPSGGQINIVVTCGVTATGQ